MTGLATLVALAALAATPQLDGLDAIYPALDALYIDLHRNPELSLQEEQTAAKMAKQLREAGYSVTERVGGWGVVGVMKNGAGPIIMLRTDMDALPVKEQTKLPYASTVTATDSKGNVVPVMHACGHDIHMASWVGAARLLARAKDKWRGTLVFVGQPAEELTSGAEAMVKDGLFTRFPKPDVVLGLHDTNLIPAGQVGIVAGPASAANNAVDITFYGKGGHGASPHLTVDPVLLGARTVVALQSIVARENNPFDPAVVTVGTFHSGSKRNIISEEAKLELTVRSYKPEVQKKLLASIARIAKAEALAAGAPREPLVFVNPEEASEVVVNDVKLAGQLLTALRGKMGEANVLPIGPTTGSEDFGVFGRAAGAPAIQLRVGMVEPGLYAQAKAAGGLTPGAHTPFFAPDREPTIRAGVAALTYSALELFAHPAAKLSP
ncbi:amidohydrolase [Pseudoduganella sp. OTU4001]|uniref:amidohydrolase n=1 Tax=Pseudoduganella sp. OTU4001 TaxID=3043854 RepID=UPI00313CE526